MQILLFRFNQKKTRVQSHLMVCSSFYEFRLCLCSSVWMNPGARFTVSQNRPNQINTTSSVYSKRSTAVSKQSTHCVNASCSQIPTVSFDLGNEWDDFDDENLVHASETLLASCPIKPQVQQSVDYNMPGRVKFGFIQFMSYSEEVSV